MATQYGLLFDVTECVGCGECYSACKVKNGLKEPKEDFLTDHLSQHTYTVLEDHDGNYMRRMCMHCSDPACASVCPIAAIVKTAEGPVVYDGDKCMGCRYCMQACPHHIPRYEWFSNTPVIHKCTMCYDRVKNGEQTACAEACPTGATLFGDLEELKIEAKRRIEENPDKYYPEVYGMTEAGGTNVLILSPVSFDQLGLATNLPNSPLPQLTQQALDKIPAVVGAGSVFLTGMYWLTKRKNQIAKEKNHIGEGDSK